MTRWRAAWLPALAILAGCGSLSGGAADFVEARVVTAGVGGIAHRSALADGTVVGGHMSGGPGPPRVSRATAQLSAEDNAVLRNLAAAARSQAGRLPTEHGTSYTEVSVTYGDGAIVGERVSGHGRLSAPALQDIAELLGRYRVGGW